MRFRLTVAGQPAPLFPVITERPEADALKLPEVLKLGGGQLGGIRGSRKTVAEEIHLTFSAPQHPERKPVTIIASPAQ